MHAVLVPLLGRRRMVADGEIGTRQQACTQASLYIALPAATLQDGLRAHSLVRHQGQGCHPRPGGRLLAHLVRGSGWEAVH